MLKSGSELRLRDLYLNRLIAFQDTEPVKIITGIRRCGKSSLMKLIDVYKRQTARCLRISVSAVKMRLTRGRQAIKALLGTEE